MNQGYKTVQGVSCLTACMNNFLKVMKIPYDETHMILNSATELVYDRERSYNQNYLEIDCGVGINYLVEKCKFSYENELYLDGNEREFIESCIENQDFLTLLLDAKALDYSNVFQNSKGTKHAINVIGKNRNCFMISDGFIPVRDDELFQGYISKETIIDAWKLAGKRYYLWDFSKFEPMAECKWEDEIKKHLMRYLQGGQSGSRFFGKDAMEKFILDITESYEKDFSNYVMFLESISYVIKVYGVYASLKLLVKALERYHIAEKNGKNASVYDMAEKVVMEWDNVGIYALYAMTSTKYEKYKMFIEKLRRLNDMEIELYQKIINCI